MVLKEDDILSVISKELRIKNSTQIKVYQVETFEGKRPKIYIQTLQLNKIKGKIASLGFDVKEKETFKQITTKTDSKGNITGIISRNLHTINLVVSKKISD